MSRFFIGDSQVEGEYIRLTDSEDVKHLTRVLRVRKGEAVAVSDGAAFEYDTVMEAVEEDTVLLKILEKRPLSTEMPVTVDLYQGVPKHGKMDTIVQKSVELGVSTIIPVFMERTIPSETQKYDKRIERFRKIALSAAKQCGRGRIPEVTDALTNEGMYKALSSYDMVFFLYEDEKGTTMRDVFRESAAGYDEGSIGDRHLPYRKIALVVGPEGGFSEAEADALSALPNCRPVTVGPRILRTETAGPAALAMCVYELEL